MYALLKNFLTGILWLWSELNQSILCLYLPLHHSLLNFKEFLALALITYFLALQLVLRQTCMFVVLTFLLSLILLLLLMCICLFL